MEVELNMNDERQSWEYSEMPVGAIGYVIYNGKNVPVVMTQYMDQGKTIQALDGSRDRWSHYGPDVFRFLPGESITIKF